MMAWVSFVTSYDFLDRDRFHSCWALYFGRGVALAKDPKLSYCLIHLEGFWIHVENLSMHRRSRSLPLKLQMAITLVYEYSTGQLTMGFLPLHFQSIKKWLSVLAPLRGLLFIHDKIRLLWQFVVDPALRKNAAWGQQPLEFTHSDRNLRGIGRLLISICIFRF